jgi:hypothetical protein
MTTTTMTTTISRLYFYSTPGTSRTGHPGSSGQPPWSTPLPRALRSKHWRRSPRVARDGGGWPPPQQEQAKAPALDALFFESLREAPGCSAVGSRGGGIDPKTLQKWVWLFIERIAKLADNVVSNFIVVARRDHRLLTPPCPPLPLHRSYLRAGWAPTSWATTDSCRSMGPTSGSSRRVPQRGGMPLHPTNTR